MMKIQVLGDFIEDTVIESPLQNATEDSLHFATDDVLGIINSKRSKGFKNEIWYWNEH